MTLDRWTEVKVAWQEVCQSYAQMWPKPQVHGDHNEHAEAARAFGVAIGLRVALALALTNADYDFKLHDGCHTDTVREINHWRRVFGEPTGEGS